jgi:hypothetical protein
VRFALLALFGGLAAFSGRLAYTPSMAPKRELSWTAWAAMMGLAAHAVLGVGDIARNGSLMLYPRSPAGPVQIVASTQNGFPLLYQIEMWGSFALKVVTIVGFLAWVVSVFERAGRIEVRPRNGATRTLVGFFVPVLCFYWPYQGLRDLNDALDPDVVPEPPLRPATDAATLGYREAAIEARPPRLPAPRAPVGWWWTAWMGGMTIRFVVTFTATWVAPNWWSSPFVAAFFIFDLLDVAAAVLALLVVLRIETRLQERTRRVEAMTLDRVRAAA